MKKSNLGGNGITHKKKKTTKEQRPFEGCVWVVADQPGGGGIIYHVIFSPPT